MRLSLVPLSLCAKPILGELGFTQRRKKKMRKTLRKLFRERCDLLSRITNSHSTSCSASKMILILEPGQSNIIHLNKCRVSRDVPSQLLRRVWRAPGARRLARLDWRAVLRCVCSPVAQKWFGETNRDSRDRRGPGLCPGKIFASDGSASAHSARCKLTAV